jgi:hypothetical protein
MFGFQYDCAFYDQVFQPYGQAMVMDADGSNKQVRTDSSWEDSMPMYVPNSKLDKAKIIRRDPEDRFSMTVI